MARKIIITIIAGSLYWLLTYAVMELFTALKLPYSDSLAQVLYFIVPFLFGAGLLIAIKERTYVGVIYGALIIFVRYIITFLEVTIRQPAGPSPFVQTLFLFKIIGLYSMASSSIGGITGIILNKKKFKK